MRIAKYLLAVKCHDGKDICPAHTKPSSVAWHDSILFIIGAIHRTLHNSPPSTDLKFLNAAAKADCRHRSGQHDIDNARGTKPRHRGKICVQNVIRLSDKTDVRQINSQYYHEEVDRTLEQDNDRRESRQDKHADAAGRYRNRNRGSCRAA